ncbi:hypothetical protein MPTK1_6g14190 [Marchantia polymorpha subsp. ruderalis]|uniref:Uncharacterized protein n=2 Tax=Marchantia polymorpha TaxID=3197 RepID=A0AAF6BRW6_MARPO|nr:hypothetical protein MARPO_0047s0073 [Marchantia polymorpha]BBN14750.1 hypothetical protein Mp_6g14190 [Marchantia polymorpha subsp. ruderalis]|eukprot:PTQ39093.1 hypothetical protein MARPO_0047s0073 [Marchantia polymorpha]
MPATATGRNARKLRTLTTTFVYQWAGRVGCMLCVLQLAESMLPFWQESWQSSLTRTAESMRFQDLLVTVLRNCVNGGPL